MILHYNLENDKVRNFCIENDYYTRGTNAEYAHMLLNMCPVVETPEDILEVAKDIYYHSDIWKLRKEYSADDDEIIWNIFEMLLNTCTWVMATK